MLNFDEWLMFTLWFHERNEIPLNVKTTIFPVFGCTTFVVLHGHCRWQQFFTTNFHIALN